MKSDNQHDLTTLDTLTFPLYSDDETSLMPDELLDEFLAWTEALIPAMRHDPDNTAHTQEVFRRYCFITRDIFNARNELTMTTAEEFARSCYSVRDLAQMIKNISRIQFIAHNIIDLDNETFHYSDLDLLPGIIDEITEAIIIRERERDL